MKEFHKGKNHEGNVSLSFPLGKASKGKAREGKEREAKERLGPLDL